MKKKFSAFEPVEHKVFIYPNNDGDEVECIFKTKKPVKARRRRFNFEELSVHFGKNFHAAAKALGLHGIIYSFS